MKNIFHFSIIAIVVALMASLSANAYAKENSGNPAIIAQIEQHDTDIKAALAEGNVIEGLITQHDTDIKADIATHDGNMTTEHGTLSTEHSDLDTKLDEILAAVQNGGGSGAPVEKTGQTTSFATGDDGELKRGVAWPNPRFTDNLDGTITDNLTNLIWDKDANRFGTRNWSDALTDCNQLADNGGDLTDGSVAGDWHLANAKEYQSLIHYGAFNPAVPDTNGTGQWTQGDPFNNVQSTVYWTSSTFTGSTSSAWRVFFDNGSLLSSNKDRFSFMWCVRCGQ